MTDAPKVFSARELMDAEFDPPTYVLPGMLTEGLSVLAAKPKAGKSWMALQWALAVASGTEVMGTTPKQAHAVLYLALEDTPGGLQQRLNILWGEDQEMPDGLDFALKWPRMNQGGKEQLEDYLSDHPAVKLVIVDTLEYIREPGTGKNPYAEDVRAMRPFKEVAQQHAVALLVIHHLRKSDAEDPLDTLSGSTGITGTADNILVLHKPPKGGTTLTIKGRMIESSEVPVERNAETCKWEVGEEALDTGRTHTQQRIMQALREAAPQPLSPKEVAQRTGLPEPTVRVLMYRLERCQDIQKVARGLYTIVTAPSSAGGSLKKGVTSVTTDTHPDHGSTTAAAPPKAESDTVTLGVTSPAQATTGATGERNEHDRRDDVSDWRRRVEAFQAAVPPHFQADWMPHGSSTYPPHWNALSILGLEDYPAVEDVAEAVAPLFKPPTGERFNVVCTELGLQPLDATCALQIEDNAIYDESVLRDSYESLLRRAGEEVWYTRVDEDAAIALLRGKPPSWNPARSASLPF